MYLIPIFEKSPQSNNRSKEYIASHRKGSYLLLNRWASPFFFKWLEVVIKRRIKNNYHEITYPY